MLNFSRPITTTSNVNYESVYSVFNPPVFPFRKQSVRIINSKNGLVEYEIIAKLEGVETLFNNGKREDGAPKDDVVKNVIHELARSYPIESEDVTVESFALYLAKHLLKEFEQFVNSVALTVEMSEWPHLDKDNENGLFKNQPDSVRFAHLNQTRGHEPQLCSGIKLYEIAGNQSLQLNSLQNGAGKMPLQAIWKYSNVDMDEYLKHDQGDAHSTLDFNDIFKQVKHCIVDCIGDLDMKGHHSLNLHQVCNVILERVPRVKSIHLSAPMARNTETATTSNSRYRNDVCQTFSEAFVSRNVTLPLHYLPARHLAHHHHWGNHLHRMNRDFHVGRRDFVSKL
ncbi:hypothetical protein C9374_010139 [Naegleria lovaniensis]|uniref:factor independent urate hydroxylase n=1 Tax=Naegleria lovaniensis TaxID=51637 RepID=A0AA88GCQ6_NAELO|nr:uncharacterized protein C9374_010139 [Naegleria lovaniensis]KAG2375135.1 hypothetical protein C9374_010139 [Naegleria lovaniensis]